MGNFIKTILPGENEPEYNILIDDDSEGAAELPDGVSSYFSINKKPNLTIVSPKEKGGKGGKLNLEASSDILLKPGDDVIFYSHHRDEGKQDEIALKVLDGDDNPVKLQIQSSGQTWSTKVKTGTNTEEYNVNITTGNDTGNKKAYLKMRARAIDLRCEEHGGIALQPKGKDGDGHMNKIKFEHGGGDGLEFGTFNTEKSSLFTTEYRFNKNGTVKMATRETITSDKAVEGDDTTSLKYVKLTDDFYDIIDDNDPKTTWEAIINAGNAFEDGNLTVDKCNKILVETELTKKGNVKGLNTILQVSRKNNLPATYEELQTNGGTISEEEYNALKTDWDNIKTISVPISCDLYDIVLLVKYMKDNKKGPWEE